MQVCLTRLLLLSGSTIVQELHLKDLGSHQTGTTIVAASVADPFLLLHLSNGVAVLLKADASEGVELDSTVSMTPWCLRSNVLNGETA